MTVLERMARKGVVSRRKIGRVYFYRAELELDSARGRALEHLVDAYFDGSRESLITFLGATPPETPKKRRAAFDEFLL